MKNNSLKNLISIFEKYLKDMQSAFLKRLKNGIDKNDIVGLIPTKNEAVITLYSWRDGIEYDSDWVAGELDFFSFGIMLSLKDVIKHRDILANSTNVKSKFLLPLFATGGGDYILYDTDEESKNFGKLFIYAPSLVLSEHPVSIYDSIEIFFETVNECYKTKTYRFDADGRLEIDYDSEQEISARLNPLSNYWN